MPLLSLSFLLFLPVRIIIAAFRQRTFSAIGFLRMADPSSVPDQPMMRLRPIRLRNGNFQLFFRFCRRGCLCQSETVAHAEYVRIHCDRVFFKPNGRNDVRRLLPYSGKRFQIRKTGRHLSGKLVHNIARGGQDMRRLALVHFSNSSCVSCSMV